MKMTRAQRWRVSRRLIYGVAFLCLLFLSSVAQHTYAQSTPDTTSPRAGTVPPGTIPISATIYLPLVSTTPVITNPVVFHAIPVQGPPVDHPAVINGDLNLSLRSYISTTGVLTLTNIDGALVPDAPQLDGLFNPPRLPVFRAVYQVNDWNWRCGADGCRGAPLTNPAVTLLEMAVTPGELIRIPTRNAVIFSGDYKALVLYAEARRITIVYTREDTPAIGYVVHLEDVVVDPALLTLYTQLNAAGRSQLPALHNAENLGFAAGSTIKVAIRDTGSFMDPRSRKDWWKVH
ncbi:MAG: hypothetical protein U0350_44640 [Caldilineaceae bacterium]